VKLQAKRIYHTKTVCKSCLDVSKTRDAQKVEEFITTLEKSLPQPLCGKSRKKIRLLQGLQSMDQPCPTLARRKQICRLFEGHTETITPAIEEKRKVLIG